MTTHADKATALLALFSAVVIPWGLSGMFWPDLWLVHLMGVDTSGLDPTVAATLRNELRFLEAREFGVGVAAWAFRREIVTNRQARAAFLLVGFAAPIARLAGWLFDGLPSWTWCTFPLVEAAMCTAIAWVTAASVEEAERRG